MREKEIEKKLVQSVKARGGMAPKLVCPGIIGMPDRLILMGGGKVGFIELKASGMKPRAIQVSRHQALRALGFKVFVLDDQLMIGEVLDDIQTT